MRSFWIICLSILFTGTQALACIGPSKDFDIDFQADSYADGALAIKRTINGEKKEELLDDTGYISADLAVVHLFKSAGKDREIRNQDEVVRFLRMRLKLLKETFESAGGPKTVKAIQALDRILNDVSISRQELVEKWSAVSEAITAEEFQIQARFRDPGTSAWSKKEDPLSEFDMPSTAVSRSTSCSSNVTGFKAGAGIKALTMKHVAESFPKLDLGSGKGTK